jgi:hypothetical protein
LVSSIIAHAYRSTLLSSLVTTNYESPIDLVQDLIDREFPLFVMEKSSMFNLLRNVIAMRCLYSFIKSVVLQPFLLYRSGKKVLT